jgi:hypothetical protein
MRLVGRLLELLWFAALGVALVFSAITTERRTRQVEENASFCDPFGYLQMAQDIRHGAAVGTVPTFTLEAPHFRLLIELMQWHQVPLPVWDEMVAPLAHHYFPAADHVAVQYSPGAGLLLSLFPEGKALHALNRVVIAIYLAIGLIVLVVAAVKRLPLAAGFFILVLNLGLEILARLDNASFSVNALLVPLLLSALCLAGAWALKSAHPNAFVWMWFLVFSAGVCFGLAVLARGPVILLLPGVIWLLWPLRFRSLLKSAWVSFGIGFFLASVLPMMVHQSRVAGRWYLPTYGHENTEPHSLAKVWPNLAYYLEGKATTEYWILPVIFLGSLGLAYWSIRSPAPEKPETFLPRITLSRLVIAALLMLAVSTVYFLTHFVPNHYYLIPAIFGAVLVLALGAFKLESHDFERFSGGGLVRKGVIAVAIIIALAPGFLVIGRVWSHYEPPSTEHATKEFSLPAELADDSAWVWACSLSGTLWYYARKPAHKLSSTNAETRELVYKFVRERGEPQYIVVDDEGMKAVADEIVELGGSLEHRGDIDGSPYFLIHWPPHGPMKKVK